MASRWTGGWLCSGVLGCLSPRIGGEEGMQRPLRSAFAPKPTEAKASSNALFGFHPLLNPLPMTIAAALCKSASAARSCPS